MRQAHKKVTAENLKQQQAAGSVVAAAGFGSPEAVLGQVSTALTVLMSKASQESKVSQFKDILEILNDPKSYLPGTEHQRTEFFNNNTIRSSTLTTPKDMAFFDDYIIFQYLKQEVKEELRELVTALRTK